MYRKPNATAASRDQGPFWFLSNFHFFAIAIGFVGPSLGLSLAATAVAGILGIAIGTALQAFHASQGAEMGLPQMIQSRAQFGYRGVIVPLLATLISLVGYNVVSTVLVSDGAAALWGVNRGWVAVGLSVLAAALAIWGYDWLHRAFKIHVLDQPAAVLASDPGDSRRGGRRQAPVPFDVQLGRLCHPAGVGGQFQRHRCPLCIGLLALSPHAHPARQNHRQRVRRLGAVGNLADHRRCLASDPPRGH